MKTIVLPTFPEALVLFAQRVREDLGETAQAFSFVFEGEKLLVTTKLTGVMSVFTAEHDATSTVVSRRDGRAVYFAAFHKDCRTGESYDQLMRSLQERVGEYTVTNYLTNKLVDLLGAEKYVEHLGVCYIVVGGRRLEIKVVCENHLFTVMSGDTVLARQSIFEPLWTYQTVSAIREAKRFLASTD